MKGKYKGTYWYTGNVPEVLKGTEVDFEFIIENTENNKILGCVSDNVEMGGTPGVGRFTGTIKGNNIKFVKKMPIQSIVFYDGIRVEEEKPHKPIYYKGVINKETGVIQGDWKIRGGLEFVNRQLYFHPKTTGKWKMTRIT